MRCDIAVNLISRSRSLRPLEYVVVGHNLASHRARSAIVSALARPPVSHLSCTSHRVTYVGMAEHVHVTSGSLCSRLTTLGRG